ncbi:SUN domain-containing protein 3-like [Archocentrus centrarchus]|uniref:SUN domain-containing protein 3-like n=1 Tax=Archocentrus centrarchus TaxID=63155 RepID=UPI0011E9F9CF|nr:SUN domain-containing protein 3-like [Archocentrus centrarchus]
MYRVLKKQKSGFDSRSHRAQDLPNETGSPVKPSRTLLLVVLLCFGFFFNVVVPIGFSTAIMRKVFTRSSEDVWKHLEEHQYNELGELRSFEFHQPLSETLDNFALETLMGARIRYEKTSEPYTPEEPGLNLFGLTVISSKQPPPVRPRTLLQDWAPVIPGQCWEYEGSKGHLSAELSHSIIISHVSTGYITKNITRDETTSTAPRTFSVFGKQNIEDPDFCLGTFQYLPSGSPLQLFEIADHHRIVVKYLSLQIQGNWNKIQYTCIYSFRVHGKLELHDL